jgi:hypothetical protein
MPLIVLCLASARACHLLQLADDSNCICPTRLSGCRCWCSTDLQSNIQRPGTAGLCIEIPGMLQRTTYVCLDRLCMNNRVMVANWWSLADIRMRAGQAPGAPELELVPCAFMGLHSIALTRQCMPSAWRCAPTWCWLQHCMHACSFSRGLVKKVCLCMHESSPS